MATAASFKTNLKATGSSEKDAGFFYLAGWEEEGKLLGDGWG